MPTTASRDTLSINLKRMIDAEARLGEKPSIRAWAMKKDLNVRMIDRLVNRQHAVSIDSLERIAMAIGLRPWQLLIDDPLPGKTPDPPITEDDRMLLRKLRRLLDE